MKLTILTLVTNPEQRQDKWLEALQCYLTLADEVVMVNGGEYLFGFRDSVKQVPLPWPYEWNWIELPRHLNEGLKYCTGDWIIKLDIDQFFHEKDFDNIRKKLSEIPQEYEVATFQKMSMAYGGKHYQKGGQPIAFRRLPYLAIGKNLEKETDLCYAVQQTGVEVIYQAELEDIWGETKVKRIRELVPLYELPFGHNLKAYKTGIQYWNYDYFFKTQEFTRKEFWRFSRAYHRYFKSWKFGDSEEASFQVFLNMMKGRYDKAPYETKLSDHPMYVREAVKELKPEQFGYNAWGLL